MYNFLDVEVRVLGAVAKSNFEPCTVICFFLCYAFIFFIVDLGETVERLSRVTRYVTVPYHNTVRATMSVNIDLRVYTGNNVLLPGSQVPRPATVLISTKTGKIIDVREGRHVTGKAEADIADSHHWTDVGDKYLLPGLVEYV